MIALEVVVLDVGLQRPSKRRLADQDQPIQTLGANRPDKSFGVGVEVRTAGWQRADSIPEARRAAS